MFKIHSFFPFLNFWLMFASFFAAGADALASVVGGMEITIPDVGSEGEGGEPAGGEPEGGEKPEGTTVAETEEGKEEGAEAKAAKAQETAGPKLAKPLSPAANSVLKELKQSNPAAWKEFNNKLWALDAYDKKIAEHFDGGLDEAIELKSNLTNFLQEAEADDLGQIREELNGFRGIDSKIMSADPSFVNELPEEMQAGLYKMMPDFVAGWQQRDNDGYQRYFAGIVSATLQGSSKFAQNLEMAAWALEEMGLDDTAVKRVHDRLKAGLEWIKTLGEKAAAAPEKKPVQQDDALTAREKTVQQQEVQMATTRWASQYRKIYDPKMVAALKTIAGGTIPKNINVAEVLAKAVHNLTVTLGEPFAKRINEYLTAKDEQGAIKYTQAQVTEKKITEAVSKAQRYLYPGIGQKQAPAPGAQKEKAGAGGAQPAEAGFVTIKYNPKASSIDMAASDKLAKSLRISRSQLFLQNKAVLRNGKKVTWAADAENEA